ncbi:hypothetical protein E1A91_A09G000300v1 [Gossypium mustelinum]|uniref:Uncharacterized protein n=1 Tax=Gossypium mustelinum TaxID=34275 RepID=A0A5D2XS24_GOSMU|nr:hypothetical protein E1A91_A09G000300v1 [Gossypium mustelinum]
MIGSMDSGNCASKCKDNSPKLIKNSDKVCTEETNGVIIDHSATTRQGNKESSLGPITSDANRGIGEFPYKFNSPPIEVKKEQNHPHFDSDTTINQVSMVSVNHSSPRTPKDGIFDPFAPGPECMVIAPSYRKYVDEMRITVACRLNFDISVGTVGSVNHRTAADSISDEEMFESVYENLVEVIVSNQAEGFLVSCTILPGLFSNNIFSKRFLFLGRRPFILTQGTSSVNVCRSNERGKYRKFGCNSAD